MIRNDYRRALIMLRSAVKGMGGHVRLERRTLTGSMRFAITGASGSAPMSAALARKVRGRWNAVMLGNLHTDSRGQAGLNCTFDPRDIAGGTLEDYALIVVTRGGEVALTGFLNGSIEIDWAQLEACVRALFSPQEARAPVAQLPDNQAAEGAPQVDVKAEAQGEPAHIETTQPEDLNGPACACEPFATECCCEDAAQVPMPLPADTAEAPVASEAAEPAPAADSPEESGEAQAVNEEAVPTFEPLRAKEPQPQAQAQQQAAASETAQEIAPAAPIQTAEEAQGEPAPAITLLEVDPEARWPDGIEPIHALFEKLPAFTPFAAQGYVFVRAPLYWAGSDEGDSYCAIGVKAQNGAPAKVCYGLPGAFALQPPAGLDGYAWRGEGPNGWWVTFLDAQTGEEALDGE